MITSWSQRFAGLTGDRSVYAGMAAGGIGLVLSFAFRGAIPGRALGDPLPLALSVTGITTGFTYFNWRAPLYHALFAALLGLLATAAVLLLNRDAPSGRRDPLESGLVRQASQMGRRAGQIAAGINVGIVALLQVDALVVGLWYLMAGAASLMISSFIAGRAAGLWQRHGRGARPARFQIQLRRPGKTG